MPSGLHLVSNSGIYVCAKIVSFNIEKVHCPPSCRKLVKSGKVTGLLVSDVNVRSRKDVQCEPQESSMVKRHGRGCIMHKLKALFQALSSSCQTVQ